MIEEVAKNIYRIPVPLPNNPLKELNSYFLRGTDRDILIDTGFRCHACREALERGLREAGSDPAKRDVLTTHLHSDHSGLADLFAGPGRRVYMPAVDLDYEGRYLRGDLEAQRRERYLSEGFSPEELDAVFVSNPARTMALPALPENIQGLADGEALTVGEYRLQTILTPGHTSGNAMFWLEEQGILFSGDHILFDITPNITAFEGVEDSLGNYLGSPERVQDLPVRQTLPGHRKSGDFRTRVQALRRHHQARLDEVVEILKRGPAECLHDCRADDLTDPGEELVGIPAGAEVVRRGRVLGSLGLSAKTGRDRPGENGRYLAVLSGLRGIRVLRIRTACSGICRSEGMPYRKPSSKLLYYDHWVDGGGHTSGCTDVPPLHRQKTGPAPLPAFAENDFLAPDLLSLSCDISTASPYM